MVSHILPTGCKMGVDPLGPIWDFENLRNEFVKGLGAARRASSACHTNDTGGTALCHAFGHEVASWFEDLRLRDACIYVPRCAKKEKLEEDLFPDDVRFLGSRRLCFGHAATEAHASEGHHGRAESKCLDTVVA